VTGKTLNV